MSKFKRGEDAIDYYDAPTYYCGEPGCDWAQESEWNVGAMAAAKQAGIDHWNAVHGTTQGVPDGLRPWSGTILLEGKRSEDGRLLRERSVTWDTSETYLWPLMKADLLAGEVRRVWRVSLGDGCQAIRASGTIEGYGEGARIPIAAILTQTEWDTTSPDSLTLTSGQLAGVTIHVEPAWPETTILVGAFSKLQRMSLPDQRP